MVDKPPFMVDKLLHTYTNIEKAQTYINASGGTEIHDLRIRALNQNLNFICLLFINDAVSS
jgi:hypothetical protein